MAGEAPLPLAESGIRGKMRKQTFLQVTNESLNPNQIIMLARSVFTFPALTFSDHKSMHIYLCTPAIVSF